MDFSIFFSSFRLVNILWDVNSFDFGRMDLHSEKRDDRYHHVSDEMCVLKMEINDNIPVA